ncbi:hypothetical protein JA116_13230 [Morganella morganii]|uniref:hypothetical protein n=1 Tax=Morganella morganii TaxID=582 RepID=UPI000D1E30F8|nr:hypothetical protein [Morganella morganii]QXO41626.1 hypothetical protein CXB74_013375 [Morganella morganii]QXO48838.1 hypothetical protein JC861_13295 [Morganella morganii]QXO52701.1 hypothetical protein JC830_13290 [Morganella morganii]QXO60442.1 hypothetical protein JC826_13135 [Morganella morganii]QXO67971.1 hypothetical protein JC792_13140 [Morganella morganii]
MADNKFTFAHLIGLGKKARASEDDEDKKVRKAKGRKAEEDEPDEDAEDDEDREGAEDQDDEKQGRKAKKAKKAEGDDDDPDAEDDEDAEGDDEDDDENKDVKKGRRAERKRCARIFGSKAAAGRPDMAAHLAFNTRMSSSEAISTLKAMGAVQPATQRASLDSRMRAEQQVRISPDAQAPAAGTAAALVHQMTNLYNSNKGAK